MARIMMMTTEEKGHLNPMIPVAQALLARGHHVGWLSIPEPADALRQVGVEVVKCLPPPGPEHITDGEELARLVRDKLALRGWIQSLLIDSVPAWIEPLMRSFKLFGPEALVVDPMLYQGIIVSHKLDVPWVGVSSSLNPITPPNWQSDIIDNVRALSPRREALFAEYGLQPDFRVCDCLSPYGNTVFSTAEYVGEQAMPSKTYLVGPSIPRGPRGDECPLPWHRLRDGKPLIYASFGSQISWQPDVFSRIAMAVDDADLVISAGDLVGTAWADSLPANVIAVPYTPQHALLERAQVLITHGGANSAMEALYHGVPMLLSPVCNDQFHQARFAKTRGVAVILDLYEATDAEIGAALHTLQNDGDIA
ncbi:MAG: glycosyltransferase, partial [Proteobacteria bacterium]|nr:glycosyltransferase [Pseudomonadota bacterium]